MPVEWFPLEGNQITHAFWKLLMTAFQSTLGWLLWWFEFSCTAHTLKNLHLSGIDRVPPSLTFFRGENLLPDIIQISFYQEWRWHNRQRQKKYKAYRYRVLIGTRVFGPFEGVEVPTVLGHLKLHLHLWANSGETLWLKLQYGTCKVCFSVHDGISFSSCIWDLCLELEKIRVSVVSSFFCFKINDNKHYC